MSTEQEKDYSQFSPVELNSEFRQIFAAVSAVPMSMTGTLMVHDSSPEMTDEEKAVYEELLERRRRILGDELAEAVEPGGFLIDQAKGLAAARRRDSSLYNAILLNRLEPLLPFVQGTESFRDYVKREMKSVTINGTENGGSEHWLYGDDLGGIFNQQSVSEIEAKSFQIFADDIKWYGVSPFVGRVFEADYENDSNYRDLVDRGRKWKSEFQVKYKRAPLDYHGNEIVIP